MACAVDHVHPELYCIEGCCGARIVKWLDGIFYLAFDPSAVIVGGERSKTVVEVDGVELPGDVVVNGSRHQRAIFHYVIGHKKIVRRSVEL